jgi:hypothetical protein
MDDLEEGQRDWLRTCAASARFCVCCVCIAWVSEMGFLWASLVDLDLGRPARIAKLAVVSLFSIGLLFGLAPTRGIAQAPNSNVREISCPATKTFFLCKDGNNCGQINSESPQDVVVVNGVGAGDIISFEVAHPGETLPSPAQNITPNDVDFQGLGGTGTPSPDPVTVSQGGPAQTASYTVTTADASDGASRFLIQIDETPNPPQTNYARVSYKLSCEKGAKGTIKINKKIIGGDVTTAFNFSRDFGANFSLTPPADGTDSASFELYPGTYAVTELGPPDGWALTGLSCTADDSK